MRSTFILGAWLTAVCGGCAHTRGEAVEPHSAAEPTVARLRQENADLKRRVQMLEDRVLRLEREQSDELATGVRRDLPVVELEPPKHAKAADAGRVHTSSVVRPQGARSIALNPLPHSAEPDDPMSSDDTQLWAQDTSLDDAAARSYRLVGAHLVEQTKSKGPSKPDRPGRDSRGREIVAQYEAAMAIYRSGDFASAEQAFDAFARTHPDHDYADNALYWKGEAAYDQHHYADALAAFTEVVERYGGGNKAPDALLKIGLCYEKVGDLANATDVLSQLVAAYPRARASDIARARLVEIGA